MYRRSARVSKISEEKHEGTHRAPRSQSQISLFYSIICPKLTLTANSPKRQGRAGEGGSVSSESGEGERGRDEMGGPVFIQSLPLSPHSLENGPPSLPLSLSLFTRPRSVTSFPSLLIYSLGSLLLPCLLTSIARSLSLPPPPSLTVHSHSPTYCIIKGTR